jgi:hypothetical protein
MKKCLLFVISISFLLTATAGADTASWLHTHDTMILDENNNEVVWNGIVTQTLFGYEPVPPTPAPTALTESYTPTHIGDIRSHGLNFVRLDLQLNTAVYGQDYHSQTPTALNYYPRFWTLLDSLVAEAANQGMWVDLSFSINSMSGIGGAWSDGNGFPRWIYDGSWEHFNKIYPNTAIGLSDAIRDFWNTTDATAANVRIVYQTFWKDMATHFKDTPNVVFGLWNEPQSGGGETIWGGAGQPTQDQGAQMYKTFMEQTIDQIQDIEDGKHIIIVNDAYFWYWSTNPKIDRPNVVVENHAYQRIDPYLTVDNPTNDPMYFINLGWRYNQPFYLGEYGGIEEGLQTRDDTIANMQFCNTQHISRSYLDYRPWQPHPSAQTWTDIEDNLYINTTNTPTATPTVTPIAPTATPSATPTVTPTPLTAAPTRTPVAPTTAAWAASPNPFRPGRGQTARFNLAFAGNPSSYTIRIMTIKGRVVRTLNQVREWDGRDDQSRLCEGGLYLFRLEAGDQRVNGTIVLLNE